MADRSASVTMPQNKPNDEKPDSPASVTTSSDGEEVKVEVSSITAENVVADDKAQEGAATKDEVKTVEPREAPVTNEEVKAGQAHDDTSNEDTPSPIKDAADINTGESHPQYRYSHPEERKALLFITRSHSAADEASSPVFKEDKDIIKLTEMVSQLTHLLAASGMGKTTTARALAYINGPDKLGPKAAMFEAKRDRKKKNQRRVSRGTAPSSGKADTTSGAQYDTNGIDESVVQDGLSSEQQTNATNSAIVSTSDEHGDAVLTQVSNNAEIIRAYHAVTNGEGVAQTDEGNAVETANGQESDKVDKPKKRFTRPKFNWRSRRRNENKNKKDGADNDENKAAEDQEPAANANDSTKEPGVTVDEQKHHPALAPIQVARAA